MIRGRYLNEMRGGGIGRDYRRPTRPIPKATSIYRTGYSLERKKQEAIRDLGPKVYDKSVSEQLKEINKATTEIPKQFRENPLTEFKMMTKANRDKILKALEAEKSKGSGEARTLLAELEEEHEKINKLNAEYNVEIESIRTGFKDVKNINALTDLLKKVVENDDTNADNTMHLIHIEQLMEGSNNMDLIYRLLDIFNKFEMFPSIALLKSRVDEDLKQQSSTIDYKAEKKDIETRGEELLSELTGDVLTQEGKDQRIRKISAWVTRVKNYKQQKGSLSSNMEETLVKFSQEDLKGGRGMNLLTRISKLFDVTSSSSSGTSGRPSTESAGGVTPPKGKFKKKPKI